MSDVLDTSVEPHGLRPRPGTVPLSVLIEFICQKVYTDLMRLVDLLPSKTDLEKKIEIANFFSRTRHLLIRLEALVKWSTNASKVDKCEKISNFLEEQSFFLLSAANTLSRLLRDTLISARLPQFAVLLAIDVFTNKSYTRLPKSIKTCTAPLENVSNRELSEALSDLNRIIQNRLSLTKIPRYFKVIKIANGRVHCIVPHEFRATLTLMSEALDFPWRILDIKFLIKDPVTGQKNLVHPLQLQFIRTQAQSRLLYREFDPRPPLVHLYDMLHSFSVSLQLDVLHEEAQRLRAKRSIDYFVVEAYRPGQSLVISYWHALSRTQFHSQLGLNGKVLPISYLLSIHVDPMEPQRPLTISHRPELPGVDSHRIGAILKGSTLSMEKLLARTTLIRAEHLLQDLRQEFLVLSPGPVQLSDPPLCIYVPLLWPCDVDEYLQLRVDPTQGLILATCPILATKEAGRLLPNFGASRTSTTFTSSSGTSSFDGFSRNSVLSALRSIEEALNRPSVKRTKQISNTINPSSADQSLLVPQSRSLRNLNHTESRWRIVLCQALEHLRLSIGLIRLMHTAQSANSFWQPVTRSLPLTLSPAQVRLINSAPSATSNWPHSLVRLQQAIQWPLLFVKLFPNNEYYVVCEVVPEALSVSYKYSLLVCNATSSSEINVHPNGYLVNSAPSIPGSIGLLLRATHIVPLEVSSLWFNNPSTSLSMLKSCMEKAKSQLLEKKISRVTKLLTRLNSKASPPCTNQLQSEESMKFSRSTVPTLTRLIATLEENILINCFALELSRAGIEHNGVYFDRNGCLNAIKINSFPTPSPAWQTRGVIPLSNYVDEIMLRPHFDPFTHRRTWQLDLLFTELSGSIFSSPSCATRGEQGQLQHQERLRHQTAEWSIFRLEDFSFVVKNILLEWENLCCMHALCYHVVSNPAHHLPKDVSIQSYNLKTLSLAYNVHYLVEISLRSDGAGFNLALGFNPTPPLASAKDSSNMGSAYSVEVDTNPHSTTRSYLEELLNASKSVHTLIKTLTRTLGFMRAVDPLRDRTLSVNGLKKSVCSSALRSVRNMILIALSTHDLILIYRGSLSLRITLVPSRFTSTQAPADTVHLSDAYSLLINPDTPFSPNLDSSLSNLVALPYLKFFLASLQEAFRLDTEGESWSGLTVPQFAKLLRCPRLSPKSIGRTRNSSFGRIQPVQSLLESYLSASLLFHACIAVITSLDVPIASEFHSVDTDSTTSSDVIESGSFVARWPSLGLTTHVRLLNQRDDTELSSWKLILRIGLLQSTPNSNTIDYGSQDTFSVIEEFFEKRVCVPPFQPSAVTAFFRLFALPLHAFRSVVRLLPIDLNPSTHPSTPIQVRLGLVGLGHCRRIGSSAVPTRGQTTVVGGQAAETTVSQTPDLVPGLPGILIRPPRITLQLLVWRAQRQIPSKCLGPPLAQLIPVGYDWDTNRVAILTSGPQTIPNLDPNSNLPQLLLESDVEMKANMSASNNGESALVQLALLITQTAAAAACPPTAPIYSPN